MCVVGVAVSPLGVRAPPQTKLLTDSTVLPELSRACGLRAGLYRALSLTPPRLPGWRDGRGHQVTHRMLLLVDSHLRVRGRLAYRGEGAGTPVPSHAVLVAQGQARRAVPVSGARAFQGLLVGSGLVGRELESSV